MNEDFLEDDFVVDVVVLELLSMLSSRKTFARDLVPSLFKERDSSVSREARLESMGESEAE